MSIVTSSTTNHYIFIVDCYMQCSCCHRCCQSHYFCSHTVIVSIVDAPKFPSSLILLQASLPTQHLSWPHAVLTLCPTSISMTTNPLRYQSISPTSLVPLCNNSMQLCNVMLCTLGRIKLCASWGFELCYEKMHLSKMAAKRWWYSA